MKDAMRKHLDLLGHKVRDRVTGFEGVATSVTFDLYGCIQAIVNPGAGKDGKLGEQVWMDVARLEVVSKKPVMAQPQWEEVAPLSEGKKGPAEKPSSMNKA